MAIIQNARIIQKLVDELELSPAMEKIPTELAEKILPVFQVNSEQITIKPITANIIRHESMTDADGLDVKTIFTTPATGKFFLTGIETQMADAAATGTADVWISVFIDGVERELGYFKEKSEAVTAENPNYFLVHDFSNPILIDKGTIIALNRGTVNKNTIRGTIIGYTEVD